MKKAAAVLFGSLYILLTAGVAVTAWIIANNASCAAPEPMEAAPFSSYEASGTDVVPAAPSAYLLARLDEISGRYGAVGVQAAWLRGDALFTYEYGLADRSAGRRVAPDTKYRAASLSKLAADLVFLCMEQAGLVSRAQDIGVYLGYPVRNPAYPDVPITGEMLMLHTSSLQDSEAFLLSRNANSSVPLQTLLSRADSYRGAAPGDGHVYSNFGMAVLGAVCEKAANASFETLAHRYLFAPLGIDAAFTASHLARPELVGVLYGEGGCSLETQLSAAFLPELGQTHHLVQGNLTVSAQDYIRLLYPLLHGGMAANGVRLLTPENVKAIVSAHTYAGGEGIGYGLMLHENVLREGVQLIHTGSNFGMFSAFFICPDTGEAVAVFTSGCARDPDPATGVYRVCLELARAVCGRKSVR